MRWLRFSLYTVAGIFALLLAAVILVTLDYGRFKHRIEDRVSELLGRELRIDGPLRASVGNTIEIHAENVFLANPAWATERSFIEIGTLDVTIDTWSLLRDTIVIPRAEIDGIDVNVETNEEGAASWTFEGLAGKGDTTRSQDDARPRLPVLPGEVTIRDVKLSVDGATMDSPFVVVFESVATSRPSDDEIRLAVDGKLRDTNLAFQLDAWPVSKLVEYREFNAKLNGKLGEITLIGSALVDDLLDPQRPALELQLEGPRAEYLTEVLGRERVTSGPMTLTAKFVPKGDRLDAMLEGTYGEFDIDLDGYLVQAQDLSGFDIDLSASGPDIGNVLALFGLDYEEQDPFAVHGKVTRDGRQLSIDDVRATIGDTRLTAQGEFAAFPTAKDATLSIVATGPDFGRFNRLFGMPGRLHGPFETQVALQPQNDGHTRAQITARTADINVDLQSNISPAERFVDSTLNVNITGPNISVITTAAGFSRAVAEPFAISGSVLKDNDGFRVQDVVATVGDDTLHVDGHVGDDPIRGSTNLKFDLVGTGLGTSILAILGTENTLPGGPFHLRGAVSRRGDALHLQDINAVVGDDGDYSLRVSGFLQDATGLAGSELQVSAKGASVAEIAALAGVGGMPDLPFTAAATLLRGERHTVIDNGSVVVGGNRLNFSGRVGDQPLRDDLELDFSIAVDKLDALVASFDVDTANVPRGKLAASGGIHSEAGRWIAENIEVQLGGATLTVAGTVGRPPEMNATALEWRLTGDSLNELLPPRLQSDAPGQTFEVSGLASIADREATLGKIVAAAGNISLRGDVTVSFSSPMQSGRASIRAQSPDVYQMFPHWRQPSGPQRADLGISGDVSWRDNYWEFDGVEARVADGRLLLDGSIDGPPSFDRTDLELDVTAQSLSELGFLAGRPLPDQPLKLKVRLRGAPDVMTIEPFELTVGPSDVHGRAELREGEVPAVRIELTSRLLDLTDFFPAAESVPDDKAGASVAKDRLIPDTPLPLDLLQTFELDITANAGQFRTRTFRWTDVMLNAEVDDGALNVRRFSRTGPRGGEIQLVSTLSPSGGGAADIGLQVHGSKLILGLGGADAKDIPDLPLYEFDTELEGRGATVRDVAGSLDGYVRVVGSAGRFKASSLTFFTQDFLNQLLRTLNPFIAKDPYTRVECSALLFRIDNGIATGKPALVQQTEKLRILGNAEINLQTEKIGAEFTTVPQKGLGIGISNLVNPYIKLTGTLAKPALTVNPEGVLVDGGLAVATGGLSILAKGFKDRFLSQKDACSKAISEADTLFGLPQS